MWGEGEESGKGSGVAFRVECDYKSNIPGNYLGSSQKCRLTGITVSYII